jgi:uncharacterized YigZ family protein
VYCVKTTQTIEDTIKKSRFIGIIMSCQTEKQVLQHLNQLHHAHPNASHIVFAYRIKSSNRLVMRFHDAGEPSGTAGKPVFQHLEGKNLINVLIVVIRYFGGIKLGAGGLTRAYGNTAKKVIEACTMTEYIDYAEIKQELEYKQMQHFEYQLEKLGGTIIEQGFAEKISLLVKIPEKNLSILLEQFKPVSKD